MKLKPTLEKRRKKLLKVLEEEYPEDSGIPWRGKSFIEKHNREVLPLRADKSKEWVIFSWIAPDSQEIFKVKTADIEGLRFHGIDAYRTGGLYVKPCAQPACTSLSISSSETNYCSSACSRFKDRTGEVFGRLIVLYPVFGGKHIKWCCRCKCGNLCTVSYGHLKNGNTQSCGCFNREKIRERTSISLDFIRKKVKEIYKKLGIGAFKSNLIDSIMGFYFTDWVRKRTKLSYYGGLKVLFPQLKSVTEISHVGGTGTFERLVQKTLDKFFPNLKVQYKVKPWSSSGVCLELDVFFPELNLAIEVDGNQHNDGNGWHTTTLSNNDTKKNKLCKRSGITLLRVPGQPKNVRKALESTLNLLYKNGVAPIKLTAKVILDNLDSTDWQYIANGSYPAREDLFDLYWNKNLTYEQIAGIYKVSSSTICNWLRSYSLRSQDLAA